MNRTLYSCPPLSARITREACAANRRHTRALAAGTVEPSDRSESAYQLLEAQRLRMSHCLACPGVLALARRGAIAPTLVEMGRALPAPA